MLQVDQCRSDIYTCQICVFSALVPLIYTVPRALKRCHMLPYVAIYFPYLTSSPRLLWWYNGEHSMWEIYQSLSLIDILSPCLPLWWHTHIWGWVKTYIIPIFRGIYIHKWQAILGYHFSHLGPNGFVQLSDMVELVDKEVTSRVLLPTLLGAQWHQG